MLALISFASFLIKAHIYSKPMCLRRFRQSTGVKFFLLFSTSKLFSPRIRGQSGTSIKLGISGLQVRCPNHHGQATPPRLDNSATTLFNLFSTELSLMTNRNGLVLCHLSRKVYTYYGFNCLSL